MSTTSARRTHSRSRSPRPSHSQRPERSHHHHRHHHSSKRHHSPPPAALPFSSRPLSKHDFTPLSAIFASYLDIQKSLVLSDLSHAEARGRFKRFCSHYNRGDLARGWYERVTQQLSGAVPEPAPAPTREREPLPKRVRRRSPSPSDGDDDNDSDVGPSLPGDGERGRRTARHGPGAPKTDELALQQELAEEDARYERADLRHARRADRRTQKEQLDELVPRAEAGTRERQVEKKKELNAKLGEFRERSPGGEVDESTLMGAGGEDGFKARKKAMERKKNERELRREQLLKARIAEREERMQVHREREEKTMGMLRGLAARFG
ncbi:hypothetical protein EDC01DRAFT_631405 [Geopyxis carbonaria]|nr:hypothetical protein EDC01DRAFT_631405 [Geopyxis carbonaria]